MQLLKISFIVLILSLNISCKKGSTAAISEDQTTTVVSKYGVIHTDSSRIVDKNGNQVTLHGMSLFWSQWGGSFYNANVIKWLKDDWKCTIVRAAMAVDYEGYLINPQTEFNKVSTVVDACIKEGIYVIVDWHDHHAEDHLAQSKEFFRQISLKYGNTPNIIYEIYNEPLQVSWTNVLKPYAQEIINTIRQNDPDNLIVVGTPNWSQDVDAAALSPLTGNNIAYTFHFYTSTHKQDLRNKAITAISKGLPLFVTEYGISEANGSGTINFTETQLWFNFINTYKLSTCNWSIMDKDETSAALKPGSSPNGSWKDTDLTTSGTYIRNFLRAVNASLFQNL